MKMIMVVCPEKRREDIRGLINKSEVHAYTEMDDVTGVGETGKKLGTHAWPEKSLIIFTVVSDDKKDALMKALKDCEKTLFPGEGMRAFVMPVEESI